MLELNKIYNIDALDGLKKLNDESIDLFIFSPPYNLRNNNSKIKNIQGGGLWVMKKTELAYGYESYNDAIPHDEYVKWQKSVLSECWRCLKNTGAIFYNHKPIIRKGVAILPTEYNPDLPIRQIIIWNRKGGMNFSPSFYLPSHEWIILFAKPDFRLKNRGASGIKDVWTFTCDKNNEHPAPFPINLPNNILETVRYKDIIVDPFMGSGTVAVSAKKFGCNYIGFEISKKYCEMTEKRLKSLTNP